MQQFYLPTEIVTGRGCLSQLGRVAARYGARALVVCGAGFARRSGLLDKAIDLLHQEGVEATPLRAYMVRRRCPWCRPASTAPGRRIVR